MLKRICDICGAEMKSTTPNDAFRIAKFNEKLDMCPQCIDELTMWINAKYIKSGKDKENE